MNTNVNNTHHMDISSYKPVSNNGMSNNSNGMSNNSNGMFSNSNGMSYNSNGMSNNSNGMSNNSNGMSNNSNGMSSNSNEIDLDLREEHYWTWSGSTQEQRYSYPKLTSNLYKKPSYHKSNVIRNLLDPFGETYSDNLSNPCLGKPGGKGKGSKRSLQGQAGLPTREYSPPAALFSSNPGGFSSGHPQFNSAPGGFVFYPSPPRKRKYYPSEAEEVKARSKKAGSVSGLSGVAAVLLCCLGMPSRRHDGGAGRRA